MALVERYLQIANTSAAHNAVFGGSLVAGGGAGTSGSPWADWATASAFLKDAGSDHSADDLVIYMHPACSVAGVAAADLDTWNSIGRGLRYKSLHLLRWEAKVTENALYSGWYPTFDTLRSEASGNWTRGSESAGSFVAGPGNIYKLNTFVSNVTEDIFPGTLGCWGGHERGDTRARQIDPDPDVATGVPMTRCELLSQLTQAGDFTWVYISGSNAELYVHTGSSGTDPTTTWGGFSWVASAGNGANGIFIYNSRNITFTDIMTLGGGTRLNFSATAETNDNIKFVRPRFGMCLRNGISLSTGTVGGVSSGAHLDNLCSNVLIDTPMGNAVESRRVMKGVWPSPANGSELGTQNGISTVGRIDGLTIIDPDITGFSHGQWQIAPQTEVSPDIDLYPRNVNVYVRTPGKGKFRCLGVNYCRGFNIQVPINGRISGVTVSGQTVQSQYGGQVVVSGVYFDSTCVGWSNLTGSGSNDFNAGSHLWLQPGPYNGIFANNDCKVIGCRHVVTDNFVYWGGTTAAITPPATNVHMGGLVVDKGGARFRIDTTEAGAVYTRYKTPYLCESKSSGVPPQYTIKNMLLQLAPACDGLVAQANALSPAANATGGNFTLTTDPTATSWGGLISGNQVGTLAGFGFDANLNYIGARKTPIQSRPRRGRGYL